MTIQCCMCDRVERNDEWILSGERRDGNVSHTYCPACLAEAKRKLLYRSGPAQSTFERAHAT